MADVDAIAAYIARDSPAYAATVVQRILNVTQQLPLQGAAGMVVPEYTDDRLREHSAYGYRIIYRLNGDHIRILAVIHRNRS